MLAEGNSTTLQVKISDQDHELLFNVHNLYIMDEELNAKVKAWQKMAQENTKPFKKAKARNKSSLHAFIKTKEQADAFMKLLREA